MNQVANSIKIEKATDQGWWDFYVYKEIDGSDTIAGFIKQFDNNKFEFVVGHNQGKYGKDFESISDLIFFVKSGRW